MPELTRDARRLIEKNAHEIRDYVTILRSKLERSGAVPETPMGKKERGKSNPPVSASLYDLVDANREEMRLIEPELAKALKSRAAPRGYRYDVMLRDIQTSPGSETRWPVSRQEAFSAFCESVAYRIWLREPDVRLRVVLSANGDSLDNVRGRQYETKREKRRHTVEDSYVLIARRVDAYLEREYTKTSAVEQVAYDLNCAPSRVWRALAYVEQKAS